MSAGSKTERKPDQAAIAGPVLASASSPGGAPGRKLCLSCLSHTPAAFSLHLESPKCLQIHFPWGSRWPMAEECGGVTVQLTGFRSWTETELAPWSSPWNQAEATTAPEMAAGGASSLPVLLPMHSLSDLPWERFLNESLDTNLHSESIPAQPKATRLDYHTQNT